MYPLVKHIHLLSVVLSLSLLLLRFYWLSRHSAMLNTKVIKILPHVVDTILLASAATLCVLIGQYPFADPWLTEKLFAVVAYILMGFVCLKARTAPLRWIGLIGALGWIAYIGRLAVSKQALFF